VKKRIFKIIFIGIIILFCIRVVLTIVQRVVIKMKITVVRERAGVPGVLSAQRTFLADGRKEPSRSRVGGI
jgi:hypothetical protein